MSRFSLSAFLGSFVVAFVALHMLIAFPDEPIYFIAHSDVHCEHCDPQKQESMATEAARKTSLRQRPLLSRSRIMPPFISRVSSSTPLTVPSHNISYLSSVVLLI
jgi:hypothetical protein